MRALSTALAGALLVAAVSPAAAAVTAPHKSAAGAPNGVGVTADVRCLMTMMALGQDKTRAQAGQIGVYFFMGRINARAPGFDLGAAMKSEAPQLSPAALQAELKRCGPIVAGASQALQGAINGLRPPGAATGPAPTAAPAPVPPVAAPK